MIPIIFPQANCRFKAPSDLDESQCMTIDAFRGRVAGGSVDGADVIVVAWKPSDDELKQINEGNPIFLSVMGGLPPHIIGTSFEQVVKPA